MKQEKAAKQSETIHLWWNNKPAEKKKIKINLTAILMEQCDEDGV